MNKKISFKHITGSMKIIPGVDDIDLSPRLVQKFVTHPEAGAKPFPVQELVSGHIVHIVLVNEDYEPLTEEEEGFPPIVKDQLERARADDMLRRRDANRQVRTVLQSLKRQNEIELLGETELSAEEVLDTKYPIVSLSEIALADWESQGKPIPPELQGKQDTERVRAANAIAKEAAVKEKVKTKE
jgi:hypothetical protein